MNQISPSKVACTCGLIDVHAHCLPPSYRKALKRAGLTSLDGGYPVPEWSAETAVEVMDQDGIDTMMLSVSSPMVDFIADKAERIALARAINGEIADTIAKYPGRFGGYATLPLPHFAESFEEMRYALDELRLHGVILETNSDGKYLGHSDFSPLFEEMSRRGTTLFLHRTKPACFEAVGLNRPAPLFEFPVDTARTVIDMLFSGVFERCPDIKLILPHAGGVLLSIARRIALLSEMPVMKPNPKPAAEVIRVFERIYYDLAMSADQASVDSLRILVPISQILFGTDYPFQSRNNIGVNVDRFRALEGLTLDEHRAIARSNAERLFPKMIHAAV